MPARTSQIAQVGKRQLELSNLTKVLYPDDHITKAELLEYVTLGEEKKDYIIATEEASLVWLGNLACIELHQMHSRAPHFDKPDYIAYDFDPPENFKFTEVAELAIEFKEYLESFGYHPFVKTTGRKGLHVLTPIEPRWSFEQAFEAAKA